MNSSNTGGHSLISIARNGDYAVRVQGKDATIHATTPLEGSHAIQFLKLKDHGASQLKFVRIFSPQCSGIDDEDTLDLLPRTQLVCASETRASVWRNAGLLAEIENIEPAIANCDFGASEDELLVFHTWNTKLTVFHLSTGHSFVIKTPKFSHNNGYGHRPNTKQLAILLKPDANDVLTIHEAHTYEVIGKLVLPTVDAQGLKWSPDGRWIAVWEVASAGTKVLILSADGQLYRTYSGVPTSDNTHDLGIRSLEWAPLHDGRSCALLAIGKCDGTIDLLNTRTFSSYASISHPVHIDYPSVLIWRERPSETYEGFDYIEVPGSSAFAAVAESTNLPRGVSAMHFSSAGSFMATLDQSRPNVLWIWSVKDSIALHSVLIHEDNVRQFSWHCSEPRLLIVTSRISLPCANLWCLGSSPVIARVPLQQNDNGRYEITWTSSYYNGNPLLWFSTFDTCALGSISADNGYGQFNVIHSLG